MKTRSLFTLALLALTTFTTTSAFGQTNPPGGAKKVAFEAAEVAVSLTAKAINEKKAAEGELKKAEADLQKAEADLKKAEAHLKAIKETRTAIGEADTATAAALVTWEQAASDLAAAVSAASPPPRSILSGLENDDRESREKKVETEKALNALIAKAFKDFKSADDNLDLEKLTSATLAYVPGAPTASQVDAGLATLEAAAVSDVNDKTTARDNLSTKIENTLKPAVVTAVANFIAASNLLAQYHQSSRLDLIEAALLKKPATSTQATTTTVEVKLPEELVKQLTALATQMQTLAKNVEAGTQSNTELAKAIVAQAGATAEVVKAVQTNTGATTKVAEAVNAQAATLLTKQELQQAQAMAQAQRVIDALVKIDPTQNGKFDHLISIVVLENPDLAKLAGYLDTLEKILGQKNGPNDEQLKKVIALLEQLVPNRKVAKK